MQTREMEYSSPAHKLIKFFRSSRDNWKTKHQQVKRELKLAQNQVRAVEKSRAKWRQAAAVACAEAARLRTELEEVKKPLRLIQTSPADRPPPRGAIRPRSFRRPVAVTASASSASP